MRVEADVRDGSASLAVADTGPGIPAGGHGAGLRALLPRRGRDGEPVVAPVSGSRSSRSSCGAGAARLGSWTGPGTRVEAVFPPRLAEP